MGKFIVTIKFAIKIYLISIISTVVSMMIYFLGYAVSLVILESLLGSDTSIQSWTGIISGILAFIVLIALWISLFYLGKIWQAPLNNVLKFLVGLLSVVAAVITVFIFAVYLAGVS